MIKPITPSQAKGSRVLPDQVMIVWNDAITLNLCGGHATIKQKDIVDQLMATMKASRQEVFDNKWLNVEEIFRAVGWKVTYDKPGYNESYDAAFTFEEK